MRISRMLGMALLALAAVNTASAQSQWTPVQNVPNIGSWCGGLADHDGPGVGS